MRKWVYILTLFILIGTFSGCMDTRTVEPTPENEEVEVTLYYASRAYVETGDEKIDKLIPIKKKIKPENNNLHLAMLNELKRAPDEESMATEIFSNITFLSVEVKNNIAYVDVSSKNLNGGSLQEFFVINQIVYTLTELEDIDKVQFLVDGKKAESLMGHFSIDEPLSRE